MQRLAVQPESTSIGLDTRLADQRALEQIEIALGRLPHDTRLAYVMCAIEGVAADEAARALGVARGTIWRRVHEARQVLRAAVDPEVQR